MTAILTGDIVNSRAAEAKQWSAKLRQTLSRYGKEPEEWEVFRGDSFQLEISPEKALDAALHIKAALKQIERLDVRIAIGIGDKTFESGKITGSNGSAFINSGECFDQLKKQLLAIKTPWPENDIVFNLIFAFASLTISGWSPKSAEIIEAAFENPGANQHSLAGILKIEQSNVSRGLSRAGFDEIIRMTDFYKKQIRNLC